MKKLLILLGVVGLFLIANSAAFATSVSYTEYLDQKVTRGSGGVEYTHNMPTDFEVPFDIVNSATLTIVYGVWDLDNNNNAVISGIVQETLVGTLNMNSWWSTDTLNIEAALNPFENSAKLQVILHFDVDALINTNNDWYVCSSTLNLDYENGSAPVPEPATVMLFGLGILGMAGMSRKRNLCG